MQSFQEPKDQRVAPSAQGASFPQEQPTGFSPTQARPTLPTWAWLMISGILILLLMVGAAIIQSQRAASRDYGALALQYTRPYPQLPKWAENTELPAPLVAGLRAFERRKFDLAARELSQVAAESPHYRVSRFYLGVSLLATQHFQAASEALQVAAATEAWQAREAAQYYLGVSLIGQGLPDAACTWLNPDSYHLNTRYGGPVQELYRRFCP